MWSLNLWKRRAFCREIWAIQGLCAKRVSLLDSFSLRTKSKRKIHIPCHRNPSSVDGQCRAPPDLGLCRRFEAVSAMSSASSSQYSVNPLCPLYPSHPVLRLWDGEEVYRTHVQARRMGLLQVRQTCGSFRIHCIVFRLRFSAICV
jgi:hypothetical protein